MDDINNPFLQTLRISIMPSRYLSIYLILLYILSLFVPWFSALNIFYKIFFTAIPCIGAGYYIYKIKFADKNWMVSEVIMNADGDWQVKLNNEVVYSAIVAPRVFVHPYLTVIKLIYNQTRQNFIFTIDNIDADLFRRLRVRLRFKPN